MWVTHGVIPMGCLYALCGLPTVRFRWVVTRCDVSHGAIPLGCLKRKDTQHESILAEGNLACHDLLSYCNSGYSHHRHRQVTRSRKFLYGTKDKNNPATYYFREPETTAGLPHSEGKKRILFYLIIFQYIPDI